MNRLVFDLKEKRPACALLQALYRADYTRVHVFNPSSWLTTPTADMAMVELTQEQLAAVAKVVNDKFPSHGPPRR